MSFKAQDSNSECYFIFKFKRQLNDRYPNQNQHESFERSDLADSKRRFEKVPKDTREEFIDFKPRAFYSRFV